MTPISDSQNIDLTPNQDGGRPQLPKGSPLQICPHCEALVDITEKEPLEITVCPGCGQTFAVSGQIDQYQIVEVAGRGGMGVVYKAYDAGLDRMIAVKLLRKDHSEDIALIQQLETEAAITASVNDPHVVRVYGTGHDRGRFFLAMELVDKGSLDDLINLQVRVAETQVLQMAIQIASGLRAAWQHQLIHRDVKPGNILFSDSNTAKIVDFGLAIFMAQEESVRGEVWGTPYYVAPEKLDREPEDFRSDMYSLGATLFHALAGRPPFEAETASLVALKHLKSQAVSLQTFAPWVSNPTAHIINRTLAKNPANRFQSYDELIQNFEYALDELHKQGGGTQSRARVVLETEEDKKTWTYIVLGMAAAIVLLLGVFLVMRPKSSGDTAATTTKTATSATKQASSDRLTNLEPALLMLAARDVASAAKFQEAITGGKLTPVEATWAPFLLGLAELTTGHPAEARAAFARVKDATTALKEEPFATFLSSTAATLSKAEPVPIASTANIDRGNHEAIALFALGLHNWNAGRTEDGVNLLRQFRSSQPSGTSYAWFNTLKPAVTSFVEEAASFQALADRLKAATNPADRADLAEEARNLKGALASGTTALIAPYEKEIQQHLAKANTPPTTGVYRITNKRSGKSIDVFQLKTARGTKITQYTYGQQSNQAWEIAVAPDGTCVLRAIHSDNVVDLADASTDEGGLIRMWTPNGTDAQKWTIELHGAGYFKIRAKASGKVLTVKDKSIADSIEIEQRTDTGDPSQLWRFERLGDVLSNGWSAITVGKESRANRVGEHSGTYSVTNQGDDIWNRRDSCTMVARGISGDFDLVARVIDVGKADPWTKAGLMVRSTFGADRSNVAIMVTADRIVTHQRRTRDDTDTTSEHRRDMPAPIWLKLERRGAKFSTYHSLDGQKWTQVVSEEVKTISRDSVVGFVASSHNSQKAATAKFDNLTITRH